MIELFLFIFSFYGIYTFIENITFDFLIWICFQAIPYCDTQNLIVKLLPQQLCVCVCVCLCVYTFCKEYRSQETLGTTLNFWLP